jgi:acetylornithine deacetylase/succinyl-diaminopimelate desuccinylase-like protein
LTVFRDTIGGMRRAALVAAVLVGALIATPGAQPAPNALNPTAALLQELIRVDTSNPPGHEGQIDNLLAAKLRPLGFEITIVPTPEAGKSHLIARLRGDGSRKPVLLAAHADVVGVERDQWTVDPFAAIVKDGHIYGRGAIDFKGGMAVFARAVMQLAENKIPLARDVIFMVEADEEAAPYNATWLAQTHWAEMDCEFALNEGGWIMASETGHVQYVSISTADKTSIAVVLTGHGTSTHSSMPRSDNAIFALSKAIAKLAAYETKVQLIPTTRRFFTTLANTSTPPMSRYFRDLVGNDPAAMIRADRAISKDPLLHAMMRNTIAPVLMSAGFRRNVIPSTADATINVRIIPGTDPDDIVKDFQHVIDDPTVTVRLATPSAGPSRIQPSSEDTDLYRALEREAKAIFPGAEVTPSLFQAGTDAGAWRTRGVPVYGIYPYPITADELTRMHGNDETVSIESLRLGTEMIYNTLLHVAARK